MSGRVLWVWSYVTRTQGEGKLWKCNNRFLCPSPKWLIPLLSVKFLSLLTVLNFFVHNNLWMRAHVMRTLYGLCTVGATFQCQSAISSDVYLSVGMCFGKKNDVN